MTIVLYTWHKLEPTKFKFISTIRRGKHSYTARCNKSPSFCLVIFQCLVTFYSYVLPQRYGDPYVRLVSQHDYYIHKTGLTVTVHTGGLGRCVKKGCGYGHLSR